MDVKWQSNLGVRIQPYEPPREKVGALLAHYAYAPYGRPAGIALGPDYAVTYAYDEYGRFTTVAVSNGPTFTYTYLPGTSLLVGYTNTLGLAVAYEYEPLRDLKTLVSNTWATNPISTFAYTYDPAARRTARLDDGLTTNLIAYNLRSELTSAHMSTNLYAPTYDPDGNMTSDGTWSYAWDAENRMVMASNAQVCVTYVYDSWGRMVNKEISSDCAEDCSVSYTWDNWNIIKEIQTTNKYPLITRNVWGLDVDATMQGAGGVGGLIAVIRYDEIYIPTYDANGNISKYLDADAGAFAVLRDYSPFGKPMVSIGHCDAFNYWFSTKPCCNTTRFSEYQFRKYNPEIGRWVSRDPKGEKGGRLLYGFVNNSTLHRFDMLGFDIWVENTTAVHGWHQRICVDEWIPMPAPIVNAGICCVDGTIYVKTGKKYCISFGMKNTGNGDPLDSCSGDGGISDSDSSGGNASSSEDETSLVPDVPAVFPPGFDGPNPSCDGAVYSDNQDPATNEARRLSGTCCVLDIQFMTYMQSLVYQSANYSILGQSCRSFSNAMFDYAEAQRGEICK